MDARNQKTMLLMVFSLIIGVLFGICASYMCQHFGGHEVVRNMVFENGPWNDIAESINNGRISEAENLLDKYGGHRSPALRLTLGFKQQLSCNIDRFWVDNAADGKSQRAYSSYDIRVDTLGRWFLAIFWRRQADRWIIDSCISSIPGWEGLGR